jgi:hypothetical protein
MWVAALASAMLMAGAKEAVPAGLCRSGERTVFDCELRSPGKRFSLCASKDFSAAKGSLVYRFGGPERIELELPKDTKSSQRFFHYHRYTRPLVTLLTLRFENGEFTYVIEVDDDEEERPRLYEASIEVQSDKRDVSETLTCRHFAGSLDELEGVVAKDTERTPWKEGSGIDHVTATILGAVLIGFGVLYQVKPNLFRRWFWTSTSIAQRLLGPAAYERYMRGLGLCYIVAGACFVGYALLSHSPGWGITVPRSSLACICLALFGCATTPAGSFAITGEIESQDCPKLGIFLAAKHLFVDPLGGTVFADVVNRTYALRLNGDELEATGSFLQAASYCPAASLRERWLLRGGSQLEGTLDSTWPAPYNCAVDCSVRFRIHARRLESGGEGRPAQWRSRAPGSRARHSRISES